MKLGDRVFVLSGLDVEEWEVYEIRDGGTYSGPWVRRDGRMGMHAGNYLSKHYATLDEAVSASKAARERAIKRCASEMVRLAINTNVKVRLLKPKTKNGKGGVS
jgi:hypothetical protein